MTASMFCVPFLSACRGGGVGDRSGKGESTNEGSGLQEFVLTLFECYLRLDSRKGLMQCICIGMCHVEHIMFPVVASERSITTE